MGESKFHGPNISLGLTVIHIHHLLDFACVDHRHALKHVVQSVHAQWHPLVWVQMGGTTQYVCNWASRSVWYQALNVIHNGVGNIGGSWQLTGIGLMGVPYTVYPGLTQSCLEMRHLVDTANNAFQNSHLGGFRKTT